MRTLKKVLALSIVLATLFSLTAFAAYTDEAQIDKNCVEDVNLLGALNVMQGDTSGTFRPTGTITRAEAAKMVYTVRTGGKTDASGWEGLGTFSDVPKGAWYEGYVNYCASLGIIAGVGNGKFNPNGNVTGIELAKMLLVVAGYKPDVQGYTGSSWVNNVLNDGQLAGLFDDYDMAFSAAALRQWAAKMFANAILRANMAVYFNGELINGVLTANETTVGEKYFGLATQTGVAIGNNTVDLFEEGIFSDKTSWIMAQDEWEYDFTYNIPFELLGQEIVVVYKDSDKEGGLSTGDKVYSVYASGKTNVLKTTLDAVTATVIENEDEEITGFTLKIAGINGGKAVTYGEEESFAVYFMDGAIHQSASVANVDELFVASNKEVTLVFSGNKVLYAFIETTGYGVVTAINVKDGVFTMSDGEDDVVLTDEEGNTLALDEENIGDYIKFVDTVKAGDLVKVTASVKTGKLVYSVSKMTLVTGTMSKREDSKATVGGVSYSLGAFAMVDKLPTMVKNDTVYFYTDGKYVIYATSDANAAPTELSSNICYVITAAVVDGVDADGFSTGPANKVKILQADGVIKSYVYTDIDDMVEFDVDLAGGVYQYAIKSGKIYFLPEIAVPKAIGEDNVDFENTTGAGTSKYSVANKRFGTYLTNDATYFFVVDEANGVYKVMKPSELKAGATYTNVTLITGSTGLKTIAFGLMDLTEGAGGDTGSVSGAKVFAFTTSAISQATVDGEVADVIDVLMSTGETKTVVVKDETLVKGKLYEIQEVDGVYKFSEAYAVVGEKLMAVGTVEGKTATEYLVEVGTAGLNAATGEQLFNITDATKCFYLKQASVDDETYKTVTAPTKWADIAGSSVYVSVDANGNLLAMYVFLDGIID